MKMKAMNLLAAAVAAGGALLAAPTGAAPLELGLGKDGNVRVGDGGVTLEPCVVHANFRSSSKGARRDGKMPDEATGTATYELFDGKEKCADGRTTLRATADGRAFLDVTLTGVRDMTTERAGISVKLPTSLFAGGSWRASSGKGGPLDANWSSGSVVVWDGVAEWVELVPKTGDAIRFQFPKPTPVYIQDNRLWGPTFNFWIYATRDRAFKAGETRSHACYISTVAGAGGRAGRATLPADGTGPVPPGAGVGGTRSVASDGVRVVVDRPVTIRAGADWQPIDYLKDIVPGSALDFSGLLDAPAGKHGWLKNVGGHFAFEKTPGKKQRFVGVNLCSDANCPDKETGARLATRLARLGYNSVRIHHYEAARHRGIVRDDVVDDGKEGLAFDPERLDRLDWLVAKCIEKGIYVTTDLYVSRAVPWRAIGYDRDGNVKASDYKSLVLVHEPAFRNWAAFARNLLTHVNPYTGRAYKDEPALPLLSLINEGSLNCAWGRLRGYEAVKKAWADWVTERRRTEPGFAKGHDDSSKVDGGSRLQQLFALHLERRFFAKANALLRDELGVKALFTNQNLGLPLLATEQMREELYGYVDMHFYVDGAAFMGADWSPPFAIANENPAKMDVLPPVEAAFMRLPTKPFTVSEWSFAGPGKWRGAGGLITGALAALQDWDGLWRFAYSHGVGSLADSKGSPSYFDLTADPLSQASDRAFACLFLRGDLEPLADGVANRISAKEDAVDGGSGLSPGWRQGAWQVRTATSVGDAPAGWRTFDLLEQRKKSEPPVALKPNPAVTLDRERGAFSVLSPKTAGGFVPSGALRSGPIAFDVGDVAATVWASALDGNPIASSRRILVSHLTDVQSNGITYADKRRTVCLRFGWGAIVRVGRARIALALDRAADYEVWALETNGRRAEKVPVQVRNGRLHFTADVKGAGGARMLYEVVAKGE